jgi:hypothetical protein
MRANEHPESAPQPLPLEIPSFAARKEARAGELAARFNAELSPVVWDYFAAATRGSWVEVARLGEEVRQLPPPPADRGLDPAVIAQVWAAIRAIHMASAQFALAEPKYAFVMHFIMAIAPEPLSAIPPERVEQDNRFWRAQLGQLLGPWLCPETSVGEICAFAERVFLRTDLGDFVGDPKYVANEHTCRAFSKLRRTRRSN